MTVSSQGPSTRRRGRTSPTSWNATTGSGAGAGAWASTPRGSGATRPPSRTGPTRSAGSSPGRTHAALVYDGDDVRRLVPVRVARRAAPDQEPAGVRGEGWRRRHVAHHLLLRRPGHRGRGRRRRAGGALDEIARLGGGTVESYPEDVEGRKVSGSFLHNATVALFEGQGFERTRRIGKNRWVVTRLVPAG